MSSKPYVHYERARCKVDGDVTLAGTASRSRADTVPSPPSRVVPKQNRLVTSRCE